MRYSTTKAIIHRLLPGTFQEYSGLGFTQPGSYNSGSLGFPQPGAYNSGALGSGISMSTNMMLGLALGAVGVVLYCKHQGKLKGVAA